MLIINNQSEAAVCKYVWWGMHTVIQGRYGFYAAYFSMNFSREQPNNYYFDSCLRCWKPAE